MKLDGNVPKVSPIMGPPHSLEYAGRIQVWKPSETEVLRLTKRVSLSADEKKLEKQPKPSTPFLSVSTFMSQFVICRELYRTGGCGLPAVVRP